MLYSFNVYLSCYFVLLIIFLKHKIRSGYRLRSLMEERSRSLKNDVVIQNKQTELEIYRQFEMAQIDTKIDKRKIDFYWKKFKYLKRRNKMDNSVIRSEQSSIDRLAERIVDAEFENQHFLKGVLNRMIIYDPHIPQGHVTF